MNRLVQTTEFEDWSSRLRDHRARAAIVARIRRMEAGNFGDVAPIGDGVSEARIHYGPGYRLYFVERERTIIILLCGGDKNSQSRDIARARQLAKEI
jgi:putative addiction module killer protein